ncbi:RPA-interacting protein [Spea bombifrons]|uniref:RPA-interacting protein n=1 Tax=Spea bombifrons TaxID=233779 RepID=UPI00234A367E|nr:RPA-interacting protein [Spea bombifrons]
MEAAMRHRVLYKGTTPPWKETYRKRCVERLKSNRSKLLDKFRQVGEKLHSENGESVLVQEVMEEEWKAMQSDNGGFPSLWKKGTFSHALGILQDPDELATLEEIKRELLVEEQAMVVEIENILRFEEECLDSVVGLNQANQIVCPVCNLNYMTVTSCFIVCQCGVHINTRSQGMSVEKLHSLLEANLTAHGYNCSQDPIFSVAVGLEGMASLFMSCQACDAMAVIV